MKLHIHACIHSIHKHTHTHTHTYVYNYHAYLGCKTSFILFCEFEDVIQPV